MNTQDIGVDRNSNYKALEKLCFLRLQMCCRLVSAL